MYKEIVEHLTVQKIGQYGIVKVKEQKYFDNGKKWGSPNLIYDVCLDGGEGDIVASFYLLKYARQWAKEN